MSHTPRFGRLARTLRRVAHSTSTCFLLAGALAALSAPAALAQTAVSLSLDDAIARALDYDPGLRAAQAGVDAAIGGRVQARTRPNPQLDIEVENFDGSGELRGFDSAETTFSLSQEVELGGQRRARIALAEGELRGAELDRAIRGLDLIRDVQQAYYDALAADAKTAIARERLQTAEALNASVARRVAAARDPLMAGARAEA
ncbi:MAG: TolC family protein, partial [Vitreimonas sp.]